MHARALQILHDRSCSLATQHAYGALNVLDSSLVLDDDHNFSIANELILLSQDRRESFLQQLTDPSYARYVLELIFQSASYCRDFSYNEHELRREHILGLTPLSSEQKQDRIFLQRVINLIEYSGVNLIWVDSAKRITAEARLSQTHMTHHYNAVRALSVLSDSPQVIAEWLRSHTEDIHRESAIEKFTITPSLCFTERNRTPGILHKWTLETFDEARSPTGLKSFWIWQDAPFGLLLLRKNQPQAVMSFSFDYEDRALIVHQMQGISAIACERDGQGIQDAHQIFFKPKLFGIHYRELFLEAAETIAVQCNMPSVRVIGGANNIWIKPNRWKKSPTYTLAEATAHYDTTAFQRGYLEREDGNWEIQLKS